MSTVYVDHDDEQIFIMHAGMACEMIRTTAQIIRDGHDATKWRREGQEMILACREILESLTRNLASDCLPETKARLAAVIALAQGGGK